MSHKKHIATHVGGQSCGHFGYLMYANPTDFLTFVDNEYLQFLGLGVGIFIAVLAFAKSRNWW